MRLGVSNIAWTFEERFAAYDMMQRAGVTGLEIAPGILFAGEDDVLEPGEAAVRRALGETAAAGLALVSMQSLLFGVDGAALFGPPEARDRLADAMGRAIALAGRLGIANMVFGSPRQRVLPDGLPQDVAWRQAADLFRALGDAARAVGTRIAIEPNPAAYGTNFLNTLAQARAFVDLVDHPAITLILDTGAMSMNQETADIVALAGRFGHVHLSEPQLAPAPAKAAPTQALLQALAAGGYRGAVSIEMKRAPGGLADLDAAMARMCSAARAAGVVA